MRISEHVVERYIERYKPERNPASQKYKKFIKAVLKNHLEERVNFMNKDGAYRIREHIYVIVRNQTAITVFNKDFRHSDFVSLDDIQESDNRLSKHNNNNSVKRIEQKHRKKTKEMGLGRSRKKRGSRKGLWVSRGN